VDLQIAFDHDIVGVGRRQIELARDIHQSYPARKQSVKPGAAEASRDLATSSSPASCTVEHELPGGAPQTRCCP
jgi:hypothetical protein